MVTSTGMGRWGKPLNWCVVGVRSKGVGEGGHVKLKNVRI